MRRAVRTRKASGFTLVEVLVAIFAMALLAGMAWQGIDGIARTREASEQRLDALLRAQTVMAQWEQDLSLLQDSVAVPPLSFDGATLRITRRQEAGLQVVAWSLRGDQLWRWAGPVVTSRRELQDQWLQSQQLMGSEAGQLMTLQGIVQWQIFCWRGNAWTNCQSSNDVAVAGGTAAAAAAGAGGVPPAGAGVGVGAGAGAGGAPAGAAQQLLPTGIRLILGFAAGAGVGSGGNLTRDVALAPL